MTEKKNNYFFAVSDLLQRTEERLAARELRSDDPGQEARELLAYALGVLPSELPKRAGETVDAHLHGELMRLLSRRLQGEPTGTIVGAVELLGLRFKVDRRGALPPPGLPLLVDAALEQTPADVHGHALDLFCGIGAAGICVAHARPGLRVDLADVSAEAMELARENADRLIPGRAHCWAGDLFEQLPRGRRYAVVTASPPWICDGPDAAQSFFGGPDGLDVVRRLIGDLPAWLAPGGVYAQTCDPSQVGTVQSLLSGLREARAHADKEGVLRVVSAKRA